MDRTKLEDRLCEEGFVWDARQAAWLRPGTRQRAAIVLTPTGMQIRKYSI